MTLASDRRRTACALVAALLVAGACSSPQGTEQPENSLLGKGKDRPKQGSNSQKGRGQGKGSTPKGGPAGAVTPAPGQPAIAAPDPGASAPADSGSAKTETEITSSGADPRTASVLVTEPDPDAEKSGLPPDYADIVSTKVEGLGDSFRVTLTFRGDLPSKMPDDKTYMVAGFAVTGSKQKDGFAFGAQADTKGWNPYGGNKESGGGFPGRMTVSGPTITFTLPWSAIGGARPFDWYSQETWFKSLAGTTHYSLDNVPNEGPAKYPAG